MNMFVEVNVIETVTEEIKKEGDPPFRIIYEAVRVKKLGSKVYEEVYKDSMKSMLDLKPGKRMIQVRVFNIPEGKKVNTYFRAIGEKK